MLTYYITDRTQFAGGEAERRAQLLRTMGQAAAAGVDFIQLREKDLCPRDLEALAREALRVIRAEGPARLLINHRTDVALAVGADGVHLTGDDIAASDARALAAGSGSRSHLGREGRLVPHVTSQLLRRVYSQVSAEQHGAGPGAPSCGEGGAPGKAGREGGAAATQNPPRQFLVAVSCHSAQQVQLAEAHGADFAVLAPIFEKAVEKAGAQRSAAARKGIGLEELRRAAQQNPSADERVEAGGPRGSFPVFALGGVDRERAPLCAASGAAGIAGIRLFQQSRDLAKLVRWLREL